MNVNKPIPSTTNWWMLYFRCRVSCFLGSTSYLAGDYFGHDIAPVDLPLFVVAITSNLHVFSYTEWWHDFRHAKKLWKKTLDPEMMSIIHLKLFIEQSRIFKRRNGLWGRHLSIRKSLHCRIRSTARTGENIGNKQFYL